MDADTIRERIETLDRTALSHVVADAWSRDGYETYRKEIGDQSFVLLAPSEPDDGRARRLVWIAGEQRVGTQRIWDISGLASEVDADGIGVVTTGGDVEAPATDADVAFVDADDIVAKVDEHGLVSEYFDDEAGTGGTADGDTDSEPSGVEPGDRTGTEQERPSGREPSPDSQPSSARASADETAPEDRDQSATGERPAGSPDRTAGKARSKRPKSMRQRDIDTNVLIWDGYTIAPVDGDGDAVPWRKVTDGDDVGRDGTERQWDGTTR